MPRSPRGFSTWACCCQAAGSMVAKSRLAGCHAPITSFAETTSTVPGSCYVCIWPTIDYAYNTHYRGTCLYLPWSLTCIVDDTGEDPGSTVSKVPDQGTNTGLGFSSSYSTASPATCIRPQGQRKQEHVAQYVCSTFIN